ncbi:SDR family oxidoreductase [Polynucleobacter paneuropaeus]|nr:SDR family oxidoreductase [Polynucleobacter paneuropaeus]
MKVLITGANGFVAQNLKIHLSEYKDIVLVPFTRNNDFTELPALLSDVDFIFHLAGVNRPKDPKEFIAGNVDLTRELCNAIIASGRTIPVIYTSSIQATQKNPYGTSKQAAEDLLFDLQSRTGNPVHVFRLPNVFGKFCKPNYNSVVATFCYNLTHDLPIKINGPTTPLKLVYIDDVVNRFIQLMDGADRDIDDNGFEILHPQYTTTVSELAHQLQAFKDSRINLITERVGAGLVRALYSTYLSYLPTNSFFYPVPVHGDARGVFVEMLKTPDCGQLSYFTAHPGITRGGHYHHSKTEKFLVIKGVACFKFRQMHTAEQFELVVNGGVPTIVETIPGWTHDVTNVGDEEMVVMLWANEIFDRAHPDTYACPL